MIPIREPVNPEGNDTILDATIDARTTAAMNTGPGRTCRTLRYRPWLPPGSRRGKMQTICLDTERCHHDL